MKLTKGLLDDSDLTKPEKSQNRKVRLKPMSAYSMESRRSSRARNPIQSYRDDVDVQLPTLRRRSMSDSSWASYLARPVEQVKVTSYEERAGAFKCAEKLQSNLQTGNPSFVKSMIRSHVYSCFWLIDLRDKPALEKLFDSENYNSGVYKIFWPILSLML